MIAIVVVVVSNHPRVTTIADRPVPECDLDRTCCHRLAPKDQRVVVVVVVAAAVVVASHNLCVFDYRVELVVYCLFDRNWTVRAESKYM